MGWCIRIDEPRGDAANSKHDSVDFTVTGDAFNALLRDQCLTRTVRHPNRRDTTLVNADPSNADPSNPLAAAGPGLAVLVSLERDMSLTARKLLALAANF